jgi:hypothetical protein
MGVSTRNDAEVPVHVGLRTYEWTPTTMFVSWTLPSIALVRATSSVLVGELRLPSCSPMNFPRDRSDIAQAFRSRPRLRPSGFGLSRNRSITHALLRGLLLAADDGIVVEKGRAGDGTMDTNRVPAALLERLGSDATAALIDLLSGARKEWTADVIANVGDRFERRLVHETAGLRIEMAQGFAGVRLELAEGLAAVRQEMADGRGAVQQEIAGVRQEMADQRFELLKWAFLFWIGQFFAVGSLIAILVRVLRPGA